ncbi:MAG: ArsR family transcriptional regulator, partial [Candidatus Dormibacteraeota bacterium]|nr:ArsR family transcriptional regulator [Candidatus Dormibacteraeota bacterium]
DVVVVDVRPSLEYLAGHIAGAISIPVDELEDRLGELPNDREIVAYCRGPYCVFSGDAVVLMRRAGIAARRLKAGFPEWSIAGREVAVGAG